MAKSKTPRRKPEPDARNPVGAAAPVRLLEDLRALIRQAREGVAQAVNAA